MFMAITELVLESKRKSQAEARKTTASSIKVTAKGGNEPKKSCCK